MSEHDNTNRGAVFPPYPEQKMILTGKANNDGQDENLIFTMTQTKDGRKIIDIYKKVGTLFENDKKGNDKAPDYTGPFDGRRISTWRQSKGDLKYMSLEISDKRTQNAGGNTSQPVDDSIPF